MSRLVPNLSMAGMLESFTAAGWRTESHSASSPEGQLVWKRLRSDGAVCLTNDKLSLHARISEFWINGRSHYTVTFDITGEYRPEMWTKLSVYSVSWDEAIEQRDRYEKELLAAWDALCAASKLGEVPV